jgi:putative endonuclease
MFEHKNKLIPGFTSRYYVNRLVYYQEFIRIEQALEAEKKIKGWSRQKKLDLIKSVNPVLEDLVTCTDSSLTL